LDGGCKQPKIKAVAIKSEEQQAVLALPPDERAVGEVFALRRSTVLRGLLTEYGEVMPQGRAGIKARYPGSFWGVLADRLPAIVIETLREQYARPG